MFYRGFVILGEAFFPFDFYQKDLKDNRDFTAGVWAAVDVDAGRTAVAAGLPPADRSACCRQGLHAGGKVSVSPFCPFYPVNPISLLLF